MRYLAPFVATLCLAQAPLANALVCGDVVTQSTSLTASIQCPPGSPYGLAVSGVGVILDLAGHTVDMGGGGVAIEAGFAPGAVVQGGIVIGAEVGIVLAGSDDARVHRMDLGAALVGIDVRGSSRVHVEASKVRAATGVQVDALAAKPSLRSDDLRLEGNAFAAAIGSSATFRVLDARVAVDRAVLRYNRASGAMFTALTLAGDDALIESNRFTSTLVASPIFPSMGIWMQAGRGAIVVGNGISGFGRGLVSAVDDSVFHRNVVTTWGLGAAVSGARNLLYCEEYVQAPGFFLTPVGILFGPTSFGNKAHDNTYTGRMTPIDDYGTGNRWSLAAPNGCP